MMAGGWGHTGELPVLPVQGTWESLRDRVGVHTGEGLDTVTGMVAEGQNQRPKC